MNSIQSKHLKSRAIQPTSNNATSTREGPDTISM